MPVLHFEEGVLAAHHLHPASACHQQQAGQSLKFRQGLTKRWVCIGHLADSPAIHAPPAPVVHSGGMRYHGLRCRDALDACKQPSDLQGQWSRADALHSDWCMHVCMWWPLHEQQHHVWCRGGQLRWAGWPSAGLTCSAPTAQLVQFPGLQRVDLSGNSITGE